MTPQPSPQGVTVTFTAFPIETAPKDRALMLYDVRCGVTHNGILYGLWTKGRWIGLTHQCWWDLNKQEIFPTHWAELSSMVPKEVEL